MSDIPFKKENKNYTESKLIVDRFALFFDDLWNKYSSYFGKNVTLSAGFLEESKHMFQSIKGDKNDKSIYNKLNNLTKITSEMLGKQEHYFLKERNNLLILYGILKEKLDSLDNFFIESHITNEWDIDNIGEDNPVKIKVINKDLYQILMPQLLTKNKIRRGAECKYLSRMLKETIHNMGENLPFFQEKVVVFTHVFKEPEHRFTPDIDNIYTSFILNSLPGPDATPHLSLFYEA
ncbi:MAG: hypothetical protein LBD41_04480 [Clostridiales Family XIII bacterium]|nr:hypothetical protein [Clostridiales Family XIII bacterium]